MKLLFQSLYDGAKFAAECAGKDYEDCTQHERADCIEVARVLILAERKIVESILRQKRAELESLEHRLEGIKALDKI